MASYTYIFCDLRTNRELARLPLSGVSFSRSLNEAGELSATLFIGAEARKKNWKDATAVLPTPQRAVYVDRDGVLVWGGIVTQRRPSSAGGSAEIIAKSFEHYLFGRHLKVNKAYPGWDQLAIVQDLVATMRAEPNGDIGLAVTMNKSGVLRDRTEWMGNERRKFGDLITSLAEVENGFEFAVDVFYDTNGNPAKRLSLGYPELGSPDARITLEYPGNIAVHPEWPEDGTGAVNSLDAIGTGEGDSMVTATGVSQYAAQQLAAGHVLWETSTDHKSVESAATLQSHANADLDDMASGVVVPKFVVRGGMHPLFGTYSMGDYVRARITSPYHPQQADGSPGVDKKARILGWNVTPPEREQEKVTLTVGAVS